MWGANENDNCRYKLAPHTFFNFTFVMIGLYIFSFTIIFQASNIHPSYKEFIPLRGHRGQEAQASHCEI